MTPNSILVEVNGVQIANWAGNPKTLSIEHFWQVGQGKAFIGTWNAEFTVSRIEMRSL